MAPPNGQQREFTEEDLASTQEAEDEFTEEDLALAQEAEAAEEPLASVEPPAMQSVPAQPTQPPPTPVEDESSVIGDFLRAQGQMLRAKTAGALNYATSSFADEFAGLLGARNDTLRAVRAGSGTPLPEFGPSYRARRDEYRAAEDKLREEDPISFHGAGVLTGLLVPNIPGVGTGLSRAMTSGLATGALGSLGATKAELTDPTAADVLQAGTETTLGAGLGGALGGGAYGLARGAGAVAPYVGQYARRLLRTGAEESAARAVGGTGSDFTYLTKSDGPDTVREYGRTILDEDVLQPFAGKQEIFSAIQPKLIQAGDDIGQNLEIADILSKNGGFDLESFLQRVEREVVWPERNNPALSAEMAAILAKLDEYREAFPSGRISFQEANNLKSTLGKTINWGNHWNNVGPSHFLESFQRRMSGIFGDEVLRQVGETAGRETAMDLADANARYGALKWAGNVSGRGIGKEIGNGPVSMKDLQAAQVAASAMSKADSPGPGALAGAAAGAAFNFARQRGASAAALGLDAMSQSQLLERMIQSNPEALGKFGLDLANAYARGGSSALAIQDYILGTTNQDYAELRRKLPSLATGEAPRE